MTSLPSRLPDHSSLPVCSTLVCVIDSGIDFDHPDLVANLHPLLGYNAMTGQVRYPDCRCAAGWRGGEGGAGPGLMLVAGWRRTRLEKAGVCQAGQRSVCKTAGHELVANLPP